MYYFHELDLNQWMSTQFPQRFVLWRVFTTYSTESVVTLSLYEQEPYSLRFLCCMIINYGRS